MCGCGCVGEVEGGGVGVCTVPFGYGHYHSCLGVERSNCLEENNTAQETL